MAEPEKRSSDAGERPPMAPRQWPAWLGIGLAWLAARIPWRLQRPLGRAIGALLYRLLRDRRHVARRNIALCFPELDASRKDATDKAVEAGRLAGEGEALRAQVRELMDAIKPQAKK